MTNKDEHREYMVAINMQIEHGVQTTKIFKAYARSLEEAIGVCIRRNPTNGAILSWEAGGIESMQLQTVDPTQYD